MTIEEEQIFIDKIKETLLPIVIYMKEEEIKKNYFKRRRAK